MSKYHQTFIKQGMCIDIEEIANEQIHQLLTELCARHTVAAGYCLLQVLFVLCSQRVNHVVSK